MRIRIPATTANLGSGFDSLGIALSLYNEVELEPWEGCHITSRDGIPVPTGEENLIYATARSLYQQCGKPFTGLKITQTNRIPLARGLGSSSACIAAGLLGANALLGAPLSQGELVDLAAAMEGHPDNSSPALLGGFVAAAMENGHVHYSRTEVPQELLFAAVIPDFELKTADARRALPQTVPLQDGVFDLSRSALVTAAMFSGNWELLRVGVQDRLHQPYRLPLIPGAEQVMDCFAQLGAYGAYISGAGSTLMGIVDAARRTQCQAALQSCLEEAGLRDWKLLLLQADNQGAVIEEV